MRILIEYIRAISLANAVWGVVLSALGIWWIRVHLQEKKEKDSAEKREIEKVIILLQGICPVWIKRKDGELVLLDKQKKREKGQEEKPQVLLDGIAPIWREAEVVKADVEEKIGTVNLQNVRAARFFRSLSKINKKHLHVIARLLIILDREGGCSSVVSRQATQDQETSWDSSTYQKLGTISLLDHTLNVAELVIARLDEEEANHMVPDAVIAALGHDIGKLPSKHAKLYAQGDHPLTSAEVVDAIPGFDKLSKKDLILTLIKLHHKDSDEFLAKTLKQADQRARQTEIAQVNARIAAAQEIAEEVGQPVETRDTTKTEKEVPPVIPPQPVVARPSIPLHSEQASAEAAWKTQRDIYGLNPADSKEKKSKEQIPVLDITKWFDADLCLGEIKRHINMISGKRFQAFSMSSGTVYVQSGLIRDILLEQAKKAEVMGIAMRDKFNDAEMRPVLLAAVNLLRGRNSIETTEVDEKYFGGHFAVHYRDGKKQKGYYTPFTAEAFLSPGESVGELEQKKKGRLMDITSVDIWKDE